jgi:PiT family inorganic phosphate transporter
MGKGIVDPTLIGPDVLVFALTGAIVWAAVCTWFGLPISITHCLVGGIAGAAAVGYGFGILNLHGLGKILIAMVLSPFLGFAIGYVVMLISLWVSRRAKPGNANRNFRLMQILSATFMAFTHGMNDTQNAMGIITAMLIIAGAISSFVVPLWVILACGLAMGLGTAVGGWRVIKTMGHKVAKLDPIHGFSAETAAAVVIGANSLLGLPISTTHIAASAIIGVGATQNVLNVRWTVARRIVGAWVLTIPAAFSVSGGLFYLYRWIAGTYF